MVVAMKPMMQCDQIQQQQQQQQRDDQAERQPKIIPQTSSDSHDDVRIVQIMDCYTDAAKIPYPTSSPSCSSKSRSFLKQTKRVRFSLSDEQDDSSLVSPSCIYFYESPFTSFCCSATASDDISDCPTEDTVSLSSCSDSSTVSSLHEDDDVCSSSSSTTTTTITTSQKCLVWWSPEEREEFRTHTFHQISVLRNECKSMVRTLLHVYKNCKHLSPPTPEEEDSNTTALNNWVASEARGLEYIVTQKFTQSSKKSLDMILNYQNFLREERSRLLEKKQAAAAAYADASASEEEFQDISNASFLTISSDQCACFLIEDEDDGEQDDDILSNDEIAELLADLSIQQSRRSRFFAHLIALADAEFVVNDQLLQQEEGDTFFDSQEFSSFNYHNS